MSDIQALPGDLLKGPFLTHFGYDPPTPPTDLPYEDSEPLESDWHRLAMNLLIEVVTAAMAGRDDYFVGGNMFIYYDADQTRNREYRGTDFFFVKNVTKQHTRRYWAVWDEDGLYPDWIVELASPSTVQVDRTTKKKIYEQVFRTRCYCIYDPATHELEGWQLDQHGVYQPLAPNEQGWLWCDPMNAWLGLWSGSYLRKPGDYPRLYDHSGRLMPIYAEAERSRADAESSRANTLEVEVARLKALLEQKQQ